MLEPKLARLEATVEAGTVSDLISLLLVGLFSKVADFLIVVGSYKSPLVLVSFVFS